MEEKKIMEQVDTILNGLAEDRCTLDDALKILRMAECCVRVGRAKLYEEAGKTALNDILKAAEPHLPNGKSPD